MNTSIMVLAVIGLVVTLIVPTNKIERAKEVEDGSTKQQQEKSNKSLTWDEAQWGDANWQ